MEEKQLFEKNKKAKNTAVAMLIFGLLLCLLGFANGTKPGPVEIARLVFFILLGAAFFLIYNKMKTSVQFMYVGGIILALAYCTIILYTKVTYMYAYVYLLLIYVMIYMNKKFTMKSILVIEALNIICLVRFLIVVPEEMQAAVIQFVFATFCCCMVYNVITLADKQASDNHVAITENLEKQSGINNKILDASSSLAEKFEIAIQTSNEMNSNMNTSSGAVAEISESVKITAEAIEQQTQLTADIQTNLKAADEETRKMKNAAEASALAVATGKQAMEQLSGQAALTGELSRRSQETTNELGVRIKAVEDITGEILNISSQTNLLALNASIEAARAGEAGKGFAVVADEIRQLSEQTKNSVNKITDIINALVSNSNEASANMAKSISATEEQNRMISNAIENINEIDDKNNILVSLIDDISRRVAEILEANTQITDSISNLSAMSEEVAASSENSREVMDASLEAVSELNRLLEEINGIAQGMANFTA